MVCEGTFFQETSLFNLVGCWNDREPLSVMYNRVISRLTNRVTKGMNRLVSWEDTVIAFWNHNILYEKPLVTHF